MNHPSQPETGNPAMTNHSETEYRIMFFTNLDMAETHILARDPQQALEKAKKLSEDTSLNLEWETYDGNCAGLEEIEIHNGDEIILTYKTSDYLARLAARDLLTALESLMHWWKNADHSDDDEMPAQIFDQAHAAIAKAKGGAA
jgi:hypothetical protein